MENYSNLFGYLIVLLFFTSNIKADSCIQCDSSTLESCVTLETQILAKECSNISSDCYTRIKDGNTVRGCTSDLTETERNNCKKENNCETCQDTVAGCNFQKFPAHRLLCLVCESDINGTCSSNIQQKEVICPNYEEKDQCIIYKSHDKNKFIRNCLSSVKDLCKNKKSCYFCEGNGCNYLHANATEIPNNANSFLFSKILFIVIPFIFILFK